MYTRRTLDAPPVYNLVPGCGACAGRLYVDRAGFRLRFSVRRSFDMVAGKPSLVSQRSSQRPDASIWSIMSDKAAQSTCGILRGPVVRWKSGISTLHIIYQPSTLGPRVAGVAFQYFRRSDVQGKGLVGIGTVTLCSGPSQER